MEFFLQMAVSGFLTGSVYALMALGKEPGPQGDSYHAWVRIAVEGDKLLLDRCFNGERSEGSGHLTTVTADKLPAVRFKFRHGDKAREATCAYQNDFDNLPRFNCYTYPEGESAIATPGLEAFFPIIWPVSMEFFDCS